MKDKKYNSAKQYLKRNKGHIQAFRLLPTEELAMIATDQVDATAIATIVLNERMPLRLTRNGATKIKEL